MSSVGRVACEVLPAFGWFLRPSSYLMAQQQALRRALPQHLKTKPTGTSEGMDGPTRRHGVCENLTDLQTRWRVWSGKSPGQSPAENKKRGITSGPKAEGLRIKPQKKRTQKTRAPTKAQTYFHHLPVLQPQSVYRPKTSIYRRQA